jgi:hypothetical protein
MLCPYNYEAVWCGEVSSLPVKVWVISATPAAPAGPKPPEPAVF